MTIKILVVDRKQQTAEVAREALVPLGCQVITASSTALAVFLARKNFPSLVVAALSDADDYLDLPGELKADPDLAHIPIILVGRQSKESAGVVVTKWLLPPLDPEGFIAEVWPYLHETLDARPEETSE